MLRVSNTDCQLLCASNCAYFVNAGGQFQPPLPGSSGYIFYKNLGAISPIQPFAHGADQINAAILFETANNYTLAFRGTLPPDIHSIPSWLDWMQDILESDVLQEPGLPGKVHQGFYNAYQSIQNDIFSTLELIYNSKNPYPKPLLITGHSKGGPMASYAAYQAKQKGFPLAGVVTFASPHPGDGDFANGYNALVRQIRYENDLDIVPFLPPSPFEVDAMIGIVDIMIWLAGRQFPSIVEVLVEIKKLLDSVRHWNYTSVGTLKFINYKYQIVPDSSGLWLNRLEDFGYDFWENGFENGFKKIAAAHGIGCGGGYQRGVCPTLCSSTE